MNEQAGFTLRGRNPDVLTCIANLSNDEVFTPPEFANRMLDTLAATWAARNGGASIWQDSSVTFLDPFTKSGVFLREITTRLIAGLADKIPDLQERVDHILTRQVFGIGITTLTTLLARRSLYCSKFANGEHSVATGFATEAGNIWFERIEHTWDGAKCSYCGAPRALFDRDKGLENHAYAFIHTNNIKARIGELFGAAMQFDVIIGNPPYQMTGGAGGSSDSSIYHLFVQQAFNLEPRFVSMVVPSRWMAGGRGLDEFRAEMLNSGHIRSLTDFPDSGAAFPGVQIKGGICYFLWDRDHTGPCDVVRMADAWQADLENHRDFDGWQYLSRKSGRDPSQVDPDKPVVFFGSFQDLLGRDKAGNIKARHEWVHTTNWDLVVFDEYHFGAWRETAKELFEGEEEGVAKKETSLEYAADLEDVNEDLGVLSESEAEFLPITTRAYLYLSGTPFKALATGEFIEEQIFNWTYTDEQKAKAEFAAKHPGKRNPYGALPQMRLLTYQMPDELLAIASAGEFDEFDLNVFFSATGTGVAAEFKFKNDVQKWLDIIRGGYAPQTVEALKTGTRPPFPYSDVRLLPYLQHSFWFLPNVAACHAMANLLKERQNTFWHDYKLIVSAGATAGIGLDALPPVRHAIGSGFDTKTITLSCGKLTTGVTVSQWSSILMLRNLKSPETYFQAAFRVQSPWSIKNPNGDDPNEEEVLKPVCFVFDFAPTRALRQLSEYGIGLSPGGANPENAVRELVSFLPVLAYDGANMTQIDAGGILDIAMAGTSATLLARKWESALLVVITTRPVPFDEQLVRRLLPVPSQPDTAATGDTFAQIALHGRANRQESSQDKGPADWRTVALMPLSDEQIVEFARDQGIDDPQALLEDLRRRNAQEFARRPQDLLELCADWRDFKRIRTHREQVASNIRIKVKPREDRREPAELSVDKAIDGASRLALAMMATRRLTIRHSAEADAGGEQAAFDPSIVLSGWSVEERKALLERALFGFASYGRVRFHHRSVAEYLAAERIQALRKKGMTARALRRLIFAETKGKIIVRPSMRPMAGWLALSDDTIFEMLRDHEPAVLLNDGDPESLTLSQRTQALRAYVERYGQGGWRGLSVPDIQVHRFASAELSDEINRLWANGIENSEIRELMLKLIEAGRITGCADIAYATACDATATRIERVFALDVLLAIDDPRLEEVIKSLVQDPVKWPDELSRIAVPRLFPKHLSVERLCQVLERVEEDKRSVGDLSWQLPRLIASEELDQPTLDALRDGLSALLSAGLRWQTNWPHITTDRPHLASALAATCVRGLGSEVTEDWLRACVLAMRVPHRDHGNDEPFTQLKKALAALPSDKKAELFWADDALHQSLHPMPDPWKRYARIVFHDGPMWIDAARDGAWIKAALADQALPLEDRAMLLEGAMRLAPSPEAWRDHTIGLKALVADQPNLLATIDDRLKPSKQDKELKRWEIEDAKRKQQHERREAKNHASWVIFWREVAEQPDEAFSAERGGNTAWNLWRAMSQAGDDSRESGWNRRFIEANFGKATADRLRLTLMEQWRNDRPTLSSERPDDEKNTYLVRWQLGLAAIYAEAEDPLWATKLSDEEAKLAARYAPIQLNGLPLWMETLAVAHLSAVDATLGEELSLELRKPAGAQWHSMLLQSIGYAPEAVVTAFVPRLRAWLDERGDLVGHNEDNVGAANRLGRVIDILMKHGDTETRAHLRDLAEQRLRENIPVSFAHVWLPLLLRLDAGAGVDALERRIAGIEPAARSEAVAWFGTLFGDRHDGIDLANPQFTPSLLLRLLRASYSHVRPTDDAVHEGSYSPDDRDYAERGRNALVGAIFEAKGEEGWAAKLEMAADPLFEHFRYRILAVAEENWASEVDSVAFDDTQAAALDKVGEAAPATNEAMFAVMVDRLDDIDDLLLRDVSPREAWAGITDEKVLRREIARELSRNANGLYKIDQEAVTADEKETDIRLRSTASDHEAVVELKLGGERSARDLRNTIGDQLVKKYMAAETSRSGCLMFSISKDRMWEHPDNGTRIGLDELINLLRDEAQKIETSLGGTLRLHIRVLDLRPRLPTELNRKKIR